MANNQNHLSQIASAGNGPTSQGYIGDIYYEGVTFLADTLDQASHCMSLNLYSNVSYWVDASRFWCLLDAAFRHLRFATLSRSSLTRSRTLCHIRDPPFFGPRKQSNKERAGAGKQGRREIILWARHPHIDQVTGWLSDKQTGSPHAYYANMQAKLICCRGVGWSEGSATHFQPSQHSQLCQQGGKQNAAYAQFPSTTKFTVKCMQISGTHT